MTYYLVALLIGLSSCVLLMILKIHSLDSLNTDIFYLESRVDRIEHEYKCYYDALIRQLQDEKARNERLLDYIRVMNKQNNKKDKSSLSVRKNEKR